MIGHHRWGKRICRDCLRGPDADRDVSLDLLVNAIVAGILLGGFYAAVTVGVTISFGMLDIVNIAQPAFIMLGSFVAYIVNSTLASTRS